MGGGWSEAEMPCEELDGALLIASARARLFSFTLESSSDVPSVLNRQLS